MIGDITPDSPKSGFAPPDDVREFTAKVKKHYAVGHDILTREWNELNGQSVLDDMDRGRKMFNAFVDESYENPADAWKWRGTRSMARNKGIAMHANLTGGYLLPKFDAQNEDSEIDRDFSEFMSDLVEWMAQDENSDYKENFLSLVFAMEHDPIVYLGAEYQQVMQEIKIRNEDGSFTKKEVLDEVLSGFKAPIYTADQILLSNAFERNLQKHVFIGKRKWIEYDEAKAKYEEYKNFEYVKAGHTVVYNEDDGLFYEVKDEDHPTMVEEVTAMFRREDMEVCYLGGVPMLEGELESHRMKHRDNFDAPRYNIQQFGFYPIGTHFIFYKSMMNALRWDNALYDASTEILANRALLEADFPIAISGVDNVDGDIVYPNAVVSLPDKDSKIQKLLPDSNLGPLVQSLNMTSDSMSEASINETMAGQLPPASQKAYTVSQAQASAKKIISGVAKGLAASISKYGLLMADIAVTQYSVAQIDQITGDSMKLKYRQFTLGNKDVGGKRMDKKLMFSEDMMSMELTQEEEDTKNLELYEESDKRGQAIYMANPKLFSQMKFLSRADYKEVFDNDDQTMQALLQGLEAQMRQNPYVNQETMTRELMYSFFKGRSEKFMQKPTEQPVLPEGTASPVAQQAQQKAVASSMTGIGT